MKRQTVWLAVALSPVAMAAQSAGPSQATVLTISPAATGCPVSLRAQHKADGSMVQVDNTHPRGIGQWLHLVLEDRSASPPAKATVTVHGYSDKARITQAAGGDGADAVKTLTVTFAPLDDRSVAGDLWAPGMTAVTRIDLDSVTYADGTMSSFAARQGCNVTPDPFMLVADR